MEKRKCLTFLLCLILCYSLFQHTARAQSSSQISILSQGSITYSPPNVNLAVIPENWGLVYGAGKQIIALDSNVVHTAGKPSIRLDPHTANDLNTARECDGTWYAVKPGDHIVAKCWMKTEVSILEPTPDPYSGSGTRIGLDFYGDPALPHNGQLGGISSRTWPETEQGQLDNYVHWGTSVWAQRTIDFIVPTTVISTWDGQPRAVTSIVMWMQCWSSTYGATDPARAWFADAELYINPT